VLKILGRASSINVQKVMWFAAELGLDIERTDIGGKFGGNDTPEYLGLNPNGLVPVLKDGEFILWESQTIVRYLAEKYGSPPWYPADAEGRGLASQWMDWYLTRMNAPITVVFLGLIRTAPEDRDLAAMDLAAKQLADLWALIDRHLEKSDYMNGDEPTMGDVPLGCAVNRWYTLDVERPNLPRVKAYYERLQERAAYREHVMVPME